MQVRASHNSRLQSPSTSVYVSQQQAQLSLPLQFYTCLNNRLKSPSASVYKSKQQAQVTLCKCIQVKTAGSSNPLQVYTSQNSRLKSPSSSVYKSQQQAHDKRAYKTAFFFTGFFVFITYSWVSSAILIMLFVNINVSSPQSNRNCSEFTSVSC